jgi:RimJ/RimL family protein N-acetyltransferase
MFAGNKGIANEHRVKHKSIATEVRGLRINVCRRLFQSTMLHSSAAVPILETGRLRLRGHRIEDFPYSAAMWADPKVVKYLGGKPFTEEESWTRFLRYVGHWGVSGFGYWVAEEKETGTFVGEIGFADYKRDVQPSLKGVPEIGWVLESTAHGKGYATEAARRIISWGYSQFRDARTACIIDPENSASIRIASKCGYRNSVTAAYKGHPVMMFFREPRTHAPSRG